MIKNPFGYHEKVKLGKLTFKLIQPTIPDILEMGFKIDMGDKVLSVIGRMEDKEPIHTLAHAITIRRRWLKPFVSWYIDRYATWEQIQQAYLKLHSVIYGGELIKSCNLDKVTSEVVADIVGGKTLIGQIPSFAEYLHFTKEDILTTPYPILLLMCADKQRLLGEDETVRIKMSGREFMKMKS